MNNANLEEAHGQLIGILETLRREFVAGQTAGKDYRKLLDDINAIRLQLGSIIKSDTASDGEPNKPGQLLIQEVVSQLSLVDAAVSNLSKNLDELRSQLKAQNARLTHPKLYAFNGLGYQGFPRQLSKLNAERLARHWGPLLGLTIPEKELFYLAHRICQMENTCLGRLATSIEAILLRSLVARAAASNDLEALEIGTLFGLGIIAMHEANWPSFERLHFTAIDPLDGYYGSGNRDPLTGVPVTRPVLNENLRRAGIPDDRVTVIQHLSTDAIAMEEARRTSYGLLVIDGDHRYAGVKHDLESYLGTVRRGGYVLVDDYGNPSWPDVKSYVDAEVLGRKDLELVGSDWHTAVFRVAGAH